MTSTQWTHASWLQLTASANQLQRRLAFSFALFKGWWLRRLRVPYDLPPLTSLSHLFTFLFSVSPVKCMTYLSTRVWHTDNVFFTFVNVIAAVKYFYATTRRGLGGLRPGASPGPILVVSNVTDHPSTASILPTSYYSMWHCNCLWIINDWF